MNSKLMLVAALVILLLLFSGCVQEQESNGKSSFSATDYREKTIALDKKPERIVSAAPSNTEILFALGLGNKIVGVTTYCNYPKEALEIEKIGDLLNPSIEKIVSLEPDIVFAIPGLHVKVVSELEALGIPVYVSTEGTVQDVLKDIKNIGALTGNKSEAGLLVRTLKEKIDAVKEKTAGLSENEKPRVFVEIWDDPLMTSGPNTFPYDLVELAGGINAVEVEGQWVVVNNEAIIEANPDVIISTHSDTNLSVISTRVGWENMAAVKNEKLYMPDPDAISRAGPRLIDVLEELAEFLHPELFKE